jgi:hypothetical protein
VKRLTYPKSSLRGGAAVEANHLSLIFFAARDGLPMGVGTLKAHGPDSKEFLRRFFQKAASF